MPHAIVHYSKELKGDLINSVVETLHENILSAGIFPEGGLRVRTYLCDAAKIDESLNRAGFIHVQFKIGHGRSNEDLRKSGKEIFSSLERMIANANLPKPPSLSFIITELHETLNYKQNNLRTYIAGRRQHLK